MGRKFPQPDVSKRGSPGQLLQHPFLAARGPDFSDSPRSVLPPVAYAAAHIAQPQPTPWTPTKGRTSCTEVLPQPRVRCPPAPPSARSHSASLQRARRLNSILARAAQADCQGICCRFMRITAISEPARGPALKSHIWTKRRYLPQLLGSPGSVKPGCLQRTASLGLTPVAVDPGGPGGGRQKHQPQRLW